MEIKDVIYKGYVFLVSDNIVIISLKAMMLIIIVTESKNSDIKIIRTYAYVKFSEYN